MKRNNTSSSSAPAAINQSTGSSSRTSGRVSGSSTGGDWVSEMVPLLRSLDAAGRAATEEMLTFQYQRSTLSERQLYHERVDHDMIERQHGVTSMLLYRLKRGLALS